MASARWRALRVVLGSTRGGVTMMLSRNPPPLSLLWWTSTTWTTTWRRRRIVRMECHTARAENSMATTGEKMARMEEVVAGG